MGMFGLTIGRKVERKAVSLAITPIGQRKLETLSGTGIEIRALQILHDEGITTVRELEKKLGIDEHKARNLAQELTSKEWAIAQ